MFQGDGSSRGGGCSRGVGVPGGMSVPGGWEFLIPFLVYYIYRTIQRYRSIRQLVWTGLEYKGIRLKPNSTGNRNSHPP